MQKKEFAHQTATACPVKCAKTANAFRHARLRPARIQLCRNAWSKTMRRFAPARIRLAVRAKFAKTANAKSVKKAIPATVRGRKCPTAAAAVTVPVRNPVLRDNIIKKTAVPACLATKTKNAIARATAFPTALAAVIVKKPKAVPMVRNPIR